MSDKCRTECAASLSTWDADPSVSPTAGMSGLQWLMMETLTLHHFRQHASAGYCCHYRKKLYFLWQGNSPWHFFFFQLAVLRSPHEAAHTTPVGAVSVSLNRYVDSELENKLCPSATVRNSQNMTRPSDGLLWFKPPAKLLSALHIYIHMYIWHIHVNICINRHIFEFKNLTIYFNSWSG